MDRRKLYYLSHPYTTHGEPKENQKKARQIEKILREVYGIQVVNPIVIIPFGTKDEIAMGKCRHLYEACDGVIFCENWNQSKGCREEHDWAKEDSKEIVYLPDDFGVAELMRIGKSTRPYTGYLQSI